MRYAVEVARLGSLNKAAETLLIAQPNISRSIKELKADLGISIFTRSAKGMLLTPEGEAFVERATEILKQIDDMEDQYRCGVHKKQRFSVSVPRAAYISEAFAAFCAHAENPAEELGYRECDNEQTVCSVLNNECRMGILRYATEDDEHFRAMLAQKELSFETLASFSRVLLMSREHPLAQKEEITCADLAEFTEIAHGELYVPTLSRAKVMKREFPEHKGRRVFVQDRAAQLEQLSQNPQSFLWSAPLSEETLKRYRLVARVCADGQREYRDVMIRRAGYKPLKADKLFVRAVRDAAKKLSSKAVPGAVFKTLDSHFEK